MMTTCDGSGKKVVNDLTAIVEFNGTRAARCPDCGINVNVNPSGTLRKHQGRYATSTVLVDEEARGTMDLIREMRDIATKLKNQLWFAYLDSKDPRFRRLWEHQLAVSKHLSNIHVEHANGAARVQVAALLLGPDVE